MLAIALALAGCEAAPSSDQLAPAPFSFREVTPEEVARAFHRMTPDRWDRYGAGSQPYRLTGTLLLLDPMKQGDYVAEIATDAGPVRLSGLIIPPRIAETMTPGTNIAAFCQGVMIGPITAGDAVLESQCWLDREFYRGQGI